MGRAIGGRWWPFVAKKCEKVWKFRGKLLSLPAINIKLSDMIQATKTDWEDIQKEAGQLLVDLKHQIQDTEDEITGMIQKWLQLTGWDGTTYVDLNGDIRPELWDDITPEETEALEAAVVVNWRWKMVRLHLRDLRDVLGQDLTKWTEMLDNKINLRKDRK